MLLDSVILVLREVLEAAILVSVLLALSRSLRRELRWVWWCAPPAVIGSFWFASSMDTVTEAFDGSGQEVVNAALQLLVFVCIVCVVLFQGKPSSQRWATLRGLMLCAVTLALIREGSEIWIYISGFAAAPELRLSVLTGSAIGAGIGISVGILLYSGIRALRSSWQRPVCLVLLAFIGAGMVMQASLLLQQADWLESGRPLWDSTFLVSEGSLAGELLYAVFGYEATPSRIQVALYLCSFLAIASAYLVSRRMEVRSSVRQPV